MKRLVSCCLVAAIVGIAGVAGPAGASPPRARLRAFVCQRALDPAARVVSVSAVMRPLAGTRKMELRFQLRRMPGPQGPGGIVNGGDLGAWISPADPTLGQRPHDVWVLNKQVVDLAAPAAYRFRVTFRWTGAHGRVLGTAVRVSRACRQPELRPDLLVQSLKVQAIAGSQASSRYTATIRNGGATAAGPFQVQFSDGGVVEAPTVQRLAAHATLQESFVGPPCTAAAPATVTVDPTGQVDDYDRTNNALSAACPSSASDRTTRSGRRRAVL